MLISPPSSLDSALDVPRRTLLGPGPSNVHERVLKTQALPLLGHLHPEFCKIMDECKDGIRYMFQTRNRVTLALSSTGHGGMEAVMSNLLQPGEVILVANSGVWGDRAADMADRQGAAVRSIKVDPGCTFSLEEISAALSTHKPQVLFITHGESSTGVLQNLEEISAVCKKHDCLLVVDAVASLGGVPFLADQWGVDVVYTGSQKVLSAPPGITPISVSETAWAKIKNRKTPIRSFYFDLTMLANYWGCDDEPRRYHHTAPISSVYALREALALCCAEGLQTLWDRHRNCSEQLHAGLESLGLQLFVKDARCRLPTITTVRVPDGVQWKIVTGYCMKQYSLEISGGLGPTAGQVWRIGLMGTNATDNNVKLVLKALQEALHVAK